MPRTKRNKTVPLSATTRKGMQLKKALASKVKNCVDEFNSIYIFEVKTMRSKWLKEVRTEWKGSRFFIGKNKVMGIALGKSRDSEYKDNLSEVTKRLKGNVGLLFTNENKEDVIRWFTQHRYPDYARSGNEATMDVSLPEGPLDTETFKHSMEPYLRGLGLPTSLKKGVIHLTSEYTVCKEGDILTPEKCTILKLFGYFMTEFQILPKFLWTNDGVCEDL